MTFVYQHLPRDEHVGAEGDRYSATEMTLDYHGKTVLYQYTDAVGVTFCTASGSPYVGGMNVKGYVIRWKYGTGEAGLAISEIQPITDSDERREVGNLLWPGHGASRVTFT